MFYPSIIFCFNRQQECRYCEHADGSWSGGNNQGQGGPECDHKGDRGPGCDHQGQRGPECDHQGQRGSECDQSGMWLKAHCGIDR